VWILIMPYQKVRKAVLFISLILFPITLNYLSPYLIIEAATQGIINASFITFSVLFISSLFLGRYFCSHICPGGALQEFAGMAVHNKKAKGGRYNWIKYFIWVPWLGMIATFAFIAGGYTSIDPLYQMPYGISVDEPSRYIIYLGLVFALSAIVFIAGKRVGCHYICWMAPFMIIGTKIKDYFKWPSYHLEVELEKCKGCKTCDKNCTMSLLVSEMVKKGDMRNSECILCGECVDNCPEGVISTAWKWNKTL
ncbi:MAG: 4Fe-4S binding protein, partial [Candidatus Hermodarchaeota archaeon]